MDYRGDYFPDDELLDLRWTSGKVVKAIFKSFIYFCAIAIYLVIFFRMYVSSELPLVKETVLSSEAQAIYKADPKDFELYRVDSKSTSSNSGGVMLRRMLYAPKVNEFEIGVRYNSKKLTGGDLNEPFHYVLKDNKGNVFEMVNRVSDSRFEYGYERVCFGGVVIDVSDNVAYRDPESKDLSNTFGESDESVGSGIFDQVDDSLTYTFEVYYGEELIHSFRVYHRDIPLNQTSYK
ncbi:MAG: hypothetical protein J6L23_03890 [Clostridia bacterium]|nr:hypothetical protein [Clostridia bacterium]